MVRVLLLALAVATLVACSGVRIDTGPETRDEARDRSRDEAAAWRARWMEQLLRLPPERQMAFWTRHVDSVTESYLLTGESVAAQWEQMASSGQEPTGLDLQSEVDQMLEPRLANLRADEAVMEAGLAEMRAARQVDPPYLDALTGYAQLYYDVYNATFFLPNSVADYRDRLLRLRERRDRVRDDLESDLPAIGPFPFRR